MNKILSRREKYSPIRRFPWQKTFALKGLVHESLGLKSILPQRVSHGGRTRHWDRQTLGEKLPSKMTVTRALENNLLRCSCVSSAVMSGGDEIWKASEDLKLTIHHFDELII